MHIVILYKSNYLEKIFRDRIILISKNLYIYWGNYYFVSKIDENHMNHKIHKLIINWYDIFSQNYLFK